jgi:hypothetical protein
MTFPSTGLLRQIAARLGIARGNSHKILNTNDLAVCLSDQAAYIAQKCTVEYLRLRAGVSWHILFADLEFRAAVERCRWQGYRVVLADVAESALVLFRHAGVAAESARDIVASAASGALDRYGKEVPGGWAASDAPEIDARLSRALLAAPRPVHEIGHASADALFHLLPIHTNLSRHDRDLIANNVRFALCGAYARMEEQIDVAAVVEEAGGGEPVPAKPVPR